MKTPRIMVLEDEANWLKICCDCLQEDGKYEIVGTRDLEEALSLLKEQAFDIIVTDLNMRKELKEEFSGFALLELAKNNPSIRVIVITGHGNIDHAARAMRAGAYEYVTKDGDFRSKLTLAVRGALGVSLPEQELLSGRVYDDYSPGEDRIIGNSASMQTVLKNITGAAKNISHNVLIVGEKGTGKGLIAQTIHRQSQRRSGPYFVIDCSDSSMQRLKTNLFGSIGKSPRSGVEGQISKFEQAKGGTVLLENIADLEKELQSKLMRIVRNRIVDRTEENEPILLDARIIASTDKSLEKMISTGQFERPLFDALAEIDIFVPPLRDRRDSDDIPALASWFLQRYSQGRPVRFSHEAMQVLISYNYPGNVGELENIVKQSFEKANGSIVLPKHLPLEVRRYKSSRPDKSEIGRSRNSIQSKRDISSKEITTDKVVITTVAGDFKGIIGGNIATYQEVTGVSATELKQLFEQIYAVIESNKEIPSADIEDLKAEVNEIQNMIAEATNENEKVDEGFLARRFRNIARMAPDILDVIVSTLGSPLAGLGVTAKKIAEKAKEETNR